MEEEEEDAASFLCDLFGEDSRFVDFHNNTGRPVILTSRLELYRLTHQSWSTSRLILPGETQVWRFLGDTAPVPVMAFLSLLPDSYSLARDNSYKWSAAFLDTQEEATITFDGVSGPLSMSSLRTLEAGDRKGVVLHRDGQTVAPLLKLCQDRMVMDGRHRLDTEDLPSTQRDQLHILSRDYEDMKKMKIDPCEKCLEIHL